MQMPAKGKKVALKDQLDDVTFSDAFSAFHHISDTMQKHQKTDGGRVSAFFLPVARLKAAAMTKGANGEENELAVRGVTSSNVIAMRDSIGHSGALMSANFLVCEQLEQVTETGASAEHTHRPNFLLSCAEYIKVRDDCGEAYVSKAGGNCYVTNYIVSLSYLPCDTIYRLPTGLRWEPPTSSNPVAAGGLRTRNLSWLR